MLSSPCYSKKPWIPPPAKSYRKNVKSDMSAEGVLIQKRSAVERQKGGSVIVQITKEDLESLGEVQQDLKLVMQHYQMLMSTLSILQRPLMLDGEEGLDANAMISQSVQDIDEFLYSFREFEMNVSNLDNCLQSDARDLPRFLCACKLSKDLAILKVLKAYNSTTSTFQFILEAHKPQNIHSVVREHDVLKQKIEEFQNHLTSYISQISNLKKELACSKARENSMEDRISSLQSIVSQKNAEIQKLKLLSDKQSVHQRGVAENEKLLEIIEELQHKSEAEKEALKKALKIQTSRAEDAENEISNLKCKLDEQEKKEYEIAAERDKWKSELAALNNKCLELESQRFNLERKSSALENELGDGKLLQDKLTWLKVELDEKSSALEMVYEQNNKLKETVNELEERCCLVQEELNELDKSYKKLEASYQHLVENTEKNEINKKKMKDQATETKDMLLEISKENGNHKEKMKDQATETRDTLQEIERSLYILQERYDMEVKEKEKLQHRLDILESKIEDNYTRKAEQEIHSQVQTLYWPYSTEFPNQPVTDKAEMGRLEENLKAKDMKIKFLEKAQAELEKKRVSQVKDLQANLNRISLNYESLQKYVKLLKSSYTNVFGSV